MPTTLPIKVISSEPPAVPLPVCMGPPIELWVDTIKTSEDVQGFWRGYAIGGAVCAVLLIGEIVIIIMVL
jgi:hypothetical protein